MKKKYVLGILTVVVLMFGITACGKNNRINSGTKMQHRKSRKRIRTMTHLIRMSIRTDRMNKTRHSRSRQKTHRMQIIWEQEQLLCMPRTRMYPALIKRGFT